jgi:hypothetical protein
MRSMDYGSRGFVGAIGLMAVLAGIGAAISGSVELAWAALVVAAYALHLISLRRTAEQAARRAAAAERDALSEERQALARRATELAGRSAQVEEQWKLLREMVQERIRRKRGPVEPAAPTGDTKEDAIDVVSPAVGPRSEESASKRAYSRW